MNRRLEIPGALVALFALMVGGHCAQADVPVATYNYAMTDFVENAAGTTIYASVPSQNSIAVINTTTLQSTLVGIGSDPTALALSSDGSRLYVANNGSNFIGVFNTQTQAVMAPLSLGAGVNPLDIQTGNNNRLWVLTGAQNQFDSIIQIDATTGVSTGAAIGGAYGGRIRASADGNSLYYGNFGLSPSGESKFDISGATATTVWSDSLGGNGEDVALSRDGSLVAFPEGGNALNSIIQTSSHLTLGSVGPAANLAFGPNNALAYAGINDDIDVYNLTTFLQVQDIHTVGPPQLLFLDNSGGLVFSDEGTTRVYATGNAVPEPATLALLGAGACGVFIRRRRA